MGGREEGTSVSQSIGMDKGEGRWGHTHTHKSQTGARVIRMQWCAGGRTNTWRSRNSDNNGNKGNNKNGERGGD